MNNLDNESIGVEFTSRATSRLEYNYRAVQGGTVVNNERGRAHSIPLAKGIQSLLVSDIWHEKSPSDPFASSMFTSSIFRRQNPQKMLLEAGGLMVEVYHPGIQPDHNLVLVGSSPALGSWNATQGIVMTDGDFPTWRTPSLNITEELLTSEFKFVITDRLSGRVVAWEVGVNRNFASCQGSASEAIYYATAEPHFDIPQWRGVGVAIPLFSLRSQESCGVGEFADLKKMVDWARLTGQNIIQILPINDTTMDGTWRDSYPYNANSIFALHPQYIAPKSVGKLRDKGRQASFEKEAQRLNRLPAVDYEAVNNLKNNYLRELYTESGDKTTKRKEYQKFVTQNSYWLESYALFSLLRDKYSTANFALWGDESTYSQTLLDHYKEEHSKQLAYYYFVQYHLHIQLLEVHAYALAHGVALKGDIPIGVSRTSVDVWVAPHLFRLDSQAGAPPDDFSVLGQNWGFPTYNWEVMSRDGYSWWRARFSKMAEYFDAYRIDHILGFFRIWEIPLDAVHGLLGYFNPALPFTAEQMREQYGFTFEQSYTRPAINSWLLHHIFGERREEVAHKFLRPIDLDLYEFRPEYSTQATIVASVEDLSLHEGLLSLFEEILFVEDPHKAGHYHPRIAAQNTFKYRAMNQHDKTRFDALYNDFFYRRHNDFWRAEALKKLPALLDATTMLTCGEDLGMIPDSVLAVMSQEKILSLEIERMPKDPSVEFGEPCHNPYHSVCTTSTHDMNPLRAWLRENRELSNRYFAQRLGIDHQMGDDAPGWICEHIVRDHLASPSMWVILPLQDWLSIDEELRAIDPESERINIPANSRHHWRYRMHCTIEELIAHDKFNARLTNIISQRG